ncbi:MAG TPA: hypothetical protein VFE80_01320 [Beijerinckiaceae bacterium]|nr:hypothetical protein [Beijerinckiaceae bacterium]
MIVLGTVGAPQRKLFGGRASRKGAVVDSAEAGGAVPVARATLIHAQALSSPEEGERWLSGLRSDAAALDAEVGAALRELNAVLRTHRAAAADPYVREVRSSAANVVRVGYGSGDLVADGKFASAYELPEEARRRGRAAETMAPLERLAAVLSGTEEIGVAEDLVLRARLDVDAGRMREAALQARIALEAMLATVDGDDAAALSAHRQAVGEAANAALRGELDGALSEAVVAAVDDMRLVVRRA